MTVKDSIVYAPMWDAKLASNDEIELMEQSTTRSVLLTDSSITLGFNDTYNKIEDPVPLKRIGLIDKGKSGFMVREVTDSGSNLYYAGQSQYSYEHKEFLLGQFIEFDKDGERVVNIRIQNGGIDWATSNLSSQELPRKYYDLSDYTITADDNQLSITLPNDDASGGSYFEWENRAPDERLFVSEGVSEDFIDWLWELGMSRFD